MNCATVATMPQRTWTASPRAATPLQGLLNRVTVQETAFFRHPEQFEVLARDVLPTLPRPVKIWSAGCANGQEPFSLAMLLEEQGIAGSVIGTDLSTTALQRTVAARYVTRELSGLSPRRIARHLTRTRDSWQINPAIRGRVRTLYHNLLDPLPLEVQSCQVIFCRNVLIYLSPDHTRAFLRADRRHVPPERPPSSSVRPRPSGRCPTASGPSRPVTPSSTAR